MGKEKNNGREEILTILQEIFHDVFRENIVLAETTTANDIRNWDSLNHVILINKIELEFKISLSLFDVIEIKSVGDIIDAVSKKIVDGSQGN